jgi:translation initiation factor IF-3
MEYMAKGTTATYRANEQIRIPQVRLIDEHNNQIGIVETFEAMRRAREAGMDLVEVARTERPPVCRIMDYGRFKYHLKKKGRKHHEQLLKEVRMRPKTDQNDRSIKMNRALKFLCKGNKVQFTMQFRGRERAHREVAVTIFRGVVAELGDLVKVERPPSMDGRHMIMILAPNKPALDKLIEAGKKMTVEELAKPDETPAKQTPAKQTPADQPAVDQAATEKVAAEQAPTEKVAAEQAPTDKVAAEQAPTDKVAAEQTQTDKVAAEPDPPPAPATEQAVPDQQPAEHS